VSAVIGLEEALDRRKRRRTMAAVELGLAITVVSLLVITVLSPILTPSQEALAASLAVLAGVLTSLSYYHSEVLPPMPSRYRLMAEVLPEAVDSAGLTDLEKRLLAYLAERGALRPAELAEEWGVTPFAITSALLRLERAGYVRIRGLTWE